MLIMCGDFGEPGSFLGLNDGEEGRGQMPLSCTPACLHPWTPACLHHLAAYTPTPAWQEISDTGHV